MQSKEQKAEYNKRYHEANRDRLNERNRLWYQANKDIAIKQSIARTNRIRTQPLDRAMHMLRAVRARAKKRGLSFNLELPDILPALQWGSCDVTGILFEMSTANGRHPFTPSVDRVDPRKGYVRGNIQVVVWALNAMRGNWGDEILLQIAESLRRARRVKEQ